MIDSEGEQVGIIPI
ncbi:MAG: hypothetical protein PVH53_10285, partial [Desulfobacterales bacterium]